MSVRPSHVASSTAPSFLAFSSFLLCSTLPLCIDLVALEDGRLLEEMQLDGGGEHPLERRLQVREDHVLAVEATNQVAVLVANGGSVAEATAANKLENKSKMVENRSDDGWRARERRFGAQRSPLCPIVVVD